MGVSMMERVVLIELRMKASNCKLGFAKKLLGMMEGAQSVASFEGQLGCVVGFRLILTDCWPSCLRDLTTFK